jgi:hypothetical protein
MQQIIDTSGVFVSPFPARPEFIFVIAGTLAETNGPDLQMLQEVCGDLRGVGTENFRPGGFPRCRP